MKTMKLWSGTVVILCALFMLASPGYGQTTCEFMFGLAELAASGTQVEHKTNFTDVSGDCTTQVVAKVDKTNPATRASEAVSFLTVESPKQADD